MIPVHGRQSIGQRKSQQDAYEIVFDNDKDPATNTLMLLSDGMGGHVGGEIASNIAIKSFAKHFTEISSATRPSVRLREALDYANASIAGRIKAEPDLSGMGCTLIAGLKLGDKFHWVSVGDSIVYLYRGGKLKRINADHSVYGELIELVRQGKLDKAEADQNPRRHALRSALIGGKISLVDTNAVELQHNDLVLLASDGLDTLQEAEIKRLLAADKLTDVRTLSALLLTAVEEKRKPRQDNTTVIVYRHQTGSASTLAGSSVWSGGASDDPRPGKRGMLIAGIVGSALALAVLIYLVAFGGRQEPVVIAPPPAVEPTEENSFSGEIGGSDRGDTQTEGIVGDEESAEEDIAPSEDAESDVQVAPDTEQDPPADAEGVTAEDEETSADGQGE